MATQSVSLVHAFDWLARPAADPPADVVIIFGGDASLRLWSIQKLTAHGDLTQFSGDTIRWNDLRDDLSTASLFDFGDKRTIVIRGGDKFVSDHRPELESYLAKPSTANRLVIEVESIASNTKIYKAALAGHVLVACGTDTDSKLGVTAASRRKFMTTFLASRHDTKLTGGAADLLIEMLGDDMGMLDTEIAKLAVHLPPGQTINESLVKDVTEGWQGKTIWEITDAIAAGDTAESLRQLDKLISGGQKPIALLPQISYWLRKLGMATAVVEYRERSGRKVMLDDALVAAGINRPGDIARAKKQLMSLERSRGRQLLAWLLDADLRLKGTHSSDGRDRFLLEQLVMKLAKGV